MLHMFTAVVLYALSNVYVKEHPEIPYYQWAFFRAAFILIAAFIFMKIKGISVLGVNRKLLFARGLFGTMGIVLLFYTVQNTTLGTATLLQYMSPLFAVIIATTKFNEPLSKNNIIAFALAVFGVAVMRFGEIQLTTFILGIGLFAALCSALAYNCIRQLRDTDHPMTVVFYFPLITFPLTGIPTIQNWVTPTPSVWWDVFLFAAMNLVAQYFMTLSYQQNLIKNVSIIKYVGVLLSFGLGFFLFGESPTWLTGVGALIVMGALYLNTKKA